MPRDISSVRGWSILEQFYRQKRKHQKMNQVNKTRHTIQYKHSAMYRCMQLAIDTHMVPCTISCVVKKNYLTKPKIIAICGAKRSGKDVLADHLVQEYGYKKLRFAEPLKQITQTLFNFSNEQIGDGDIKDVVDERWNITPRKALQFFGTEVMQYKVQDLLPGIDRRFLACSLVSKIQPDQYYVISDMRFYHEYEEMAKLNAYVIKVDRFPVTIIPDIHPSEIEYKTIPHDAYITNDKDVDTLRKKLDGILSQSWYK